MPSPKIRLLVSVRGILDEFRSRTTQNPAAFDFGTHRVATALSELPDKSDIKEMSEMSHENKSKV